MASHPTIRIAAYCRQSVADDLEFTSTQAQREAIEGYVRSQVGQGWELVDSVYDDTGFSGATLDRPAFQKLLADVEAGSVDGIAVYSIDRLSRSIADFTELLRRFEKRGIRFVSITQSFDTSTPVGQLTLNILMSFSQFEREMIAQRTRDKMGASRRRGQYTGGRPPLGYRLVEKKLIVDPDEAEQVQEIFRLFLRLGRVAHVVAELDRRGWVTKLHTAKNGRTSGGRPFDRNVVRKLLASALYVGKVEFDGELHEGQQPEIVDPDTWARAQEILAANHRPHRRHRTQAAPLKGLLVCARCGEPMRIGYTQKGTRRYGYYECRRLRTQGATACPKSRIDVAAIESFVVERIRGIGRDPQLLQSVARQLDDPVDMDDLRATLQRFDPLWDALTTAERNELLRQLIDRVEYDGQTGRVEISFLETGLIGLGTEPGTAA